MPAPGAPYPAGHHLAGERSGSRTSDGPPAIIEFDPSEAQTAAIPSPISSPMRARTPLPSDAIDHEAVTRLDPMRLPPPPVNVTDAGSEAETLSMPVSMLLGTPQGAPNLAPARSAPSHAGAAPEVASAPSHTPPPQSAPLAPNAPPPAPQQPVQEAAPLPVTPVDAPLPTPAQPAPAPVEKRGTRTLLFALALLFAMGVGAALTLYLTGFFNRPPPPPPRVVFTIPPAVPAVADAGVTVAADAQTDATPLTASDDASALSVDASAVSDDASITVTSDDASATTSDDAAVEHHHHDHDASADATSDDASVAMTSDATAEMSDASQLAVDASEPEPEAHHEETTPSPRRHRHRHHGDGSDAGSAPTTPGLLGDPFGR